MAEFYIAYDYGDRRVIGIVVAPQRPSGLQFASREDLYAAMDALGHDWQMRREVPVPPEYPFEITAVWLEKMAETKALHNESVSPESIFSFGSIPSF